MAHVSRIEMAVENVGIAKDSGDVMSFFMITSFRNRNSGPNCGGIEITSILYWFDPL